MESLTILLKTRDNELHELGVLQGKLQVLESEHESTQALLSSKDATLQKSQDVVKAQVQKLQRIPLLEGRLDAVELECESQKRVLLQKEIELEATKGRLEDKSRELEQMVPFRNETHRLTKVLAQKDHEIVNQKHELELARAALRSNNTKILEMTAAKGRIQILEDEQTKLNGDLVREARACEEMQGKLASRESEFQESIAAQAREKRAFSSEISALKAQLDEKDKLVKSHESILQEAEKQVKLRNKEIANFQKPKELPPVRKNVTISDQVFTVAPHKPKRKANRDAPTHDRASLNGKSQASLGESQVTNLSSIPNSFSLEADRSHVPPPNSADEFQNIPSSPMLEEFLRDLPQTPVLGPVKSGPEPNAPATKVITEDSQAIDTQQGAFLLKMPEPNLQLEENAQEVGHATQFDLAAQHRAKKQTVDSIPRPSLQPSNTSNKRKHASLPSIIPDSQSHSLQQVGPRGILKTSTSQTMTSTTEIREVVGPSQVHQKKQRRSGVQDLGPVLSSSPTASFSTNGKRKLSQRSTKRSMYSGLDSGCDGDIC